MPRKPVLEGGKKEEIINAALKLFFEKGYEAVSIRMIQREVGSEVGLFYYYFKSKDEVFDLAIMQFIEGYRPGIEKIIEDGKKEPRMLLTNIFAYVHQSTALFREKYSETLHWSIRYAIREHVLEILEPYMEKALGIMIEGGMPEPKVATNVLSIVLTHGIGSMIIHIDEEKYQEVLADTQVLVYRLLGSPIDKPDRKKQQEKLLSIKAGK